MTLARVPPPREGAVRRPVGRDLSPWQRPATAVIAAVVLIAAAAVGYAIGASGRDSDEDAAAAQRAGEQRAYSVALRESAARGRDDGLRAGAAAGAAAGRRAGLRAAPGAAPRKAAAKPVGGVKDCPKTPIRNKAFVSSVRGITCAAAASEQRQANRSGHPRRTAKGFSCQRIDRLHYRCVHGAQAYRWDIGP